MREAFLAVTILVVLWNPHPVSGAGATAPAGGFPSGVCLSQARPLTPKQQAVLLGGLRRCSGFLEIHFDRAGFLVLGNRSDVVDGSALARSLVSAAVDGRDLYLIENHERSSALAFARIRAKVDYQNLRTAPELLRHVWTVEIDPFDYTELRGHTEAIRAFDPALNLLHELAHSIMRLRDSTSEEDPLGECERYVNQIRRELGLPERQSYDPANSQVVTPYGTGQRLLGELCFARAVPGKRTKKYRLTFDVENVAADLVARSTGTRALARR